MKKTLVYLLITTLLFSLTGCIGLSKKHGFGELVILGDNLTREADPDKGETEPQPVSNGTTVTISGETKNLGEKFVLRAGKHRAKIKDGSFVGDLNVTVEVNKTVTIKPTLKLAKLPFNAWKFIFDPTVLDVAVKEEVHLVGDLPGATWNPADKETYRLIKQEDGTWSAIFAMEEGKSFKIIFDDDDWNDETNVGVGGLNGGDYKVGSIDDTDTGVKVEPVLAWKFTLNPDPEIYEGIDEFEITSVHLVGDLPNASWSPENTLYSLVKQEDGTWVGYFEVEEGKEFKFILNKGSWDSSVGVGKVDGPNFKIGEYPEVVTLDF